MMLSSHLLSIFALATAFSTVFAQGTISSANLQSISPATASCDGAPFPDECATATEAAAWIDVSFQNFHIESFNAQAALVALMLFESADFKYKINHVPGVPGQGTRNMQSPAFNEKYATWLSAVCANCISAAQVEQAKSAGPEAVLELVNGSLWGFASAAWFLKTQCESSIQDGLAAGTEAGWTSYLEQCVGTTVTAERTAGWKKAIALGSWS